jgi:hypothetical protein
MRALHACLSVPRTFAPHMHKVGRADTSIPAQVSVTFAPNLSVSISMRVPLRCPLHWVVKVAESLLGL